MHTRHQKQSVNIYGIVIIWAKYLSVCHYLATSISYFKCSMRNVRSTLTVHEITKLTRRYITLVSYMSVNHLVAIIIMVTTSKLI